uniref:Tetratricopeptide SHNi-TPR domain-containing protein n=1 Tax=Pygocentrus nattereri TaxID=42514 RepID=A0AAR2KE88_PYGNA
MEEKPCSSSAADSCIDVAEEAKKLIGTGNRHLVMGDVVSAVSVFQEACAMLAEKYGDTADECGEAFFLCGKSLLELARMENTVLGNALEGVPEESSEEGEKQNDSKIESADNLDEKTRDELREQVYDAMSEDKRDSEGEVKKEEQEVKDTGDVQAQKQDDTDSSLKNKTESPIEKGDATTESPVQSEQKADENGDRTTQSPEDEVGNLQLAWEMLEVAKVIYKRKESKEDQLMAAQIFLKLGEVGAESGNYTQALEDFQECLAIQLKHLPAHSRLLAETHYQLGTTFSYTAQYSQAIEHFNNSIKVIESRLAMLQEAIDKAEEADEAKEEKGELEELKQLLPEIAEKIEDAKESQKTAAAASEAIHQTLVRHWNLGLIRMFGPCFREGHLHLHSQLKMVAHLHLQPARLGD